MQKRLKKVNESNTTKLTETFIRIAGIVDDSIVDGPGIRLTIFLQGCPHHCPGCHNPHTHDFNGGYLCCLDDILKQIDQNPLLSGVTFSGGEPFCQAKDVLPLAEAIKKRGLTLVVYSGYYFEELIQKGEHDSAVKNLLTLCDILIDGPFFIQERDLTLKYRGSKNQRLLYLENGKIVAME